MEKIIKGENWYVVKPSKEDLIEKSKTSYYHYKNRKCALCQSYFDYGKPNSYFCGLCKLYAKCIICGKEIEHIPYKEQIEDYKNLDKIRNFCSRGCRSTYSNLNYIKKHPNTMYERSKLRYENQKKLDLEDPSRIEKRAVKYRNAYLKFAKENPEKSHKLAVERGLKSKEYFLKHPEEAYSKSQKGGITNASKIGKFSLCSSPDCYKLGEKVLIVNANGLCEDCFRKSSFFLNKFTNIDKKSDKSIRQQLIDLDIILNNKIIKYEESNILNYICGAIGLYGINKKDGKKYALTAGKSNNIGQEIRTFSRILEHPEKQIPFELEKENIKDPDYGRWFDITHDYEKFEIILLTDPAGESDIDALTKEAKWALTNDAEFKYDFNHRKIENTHGYWMM